MAYQQLKTSLVELIFMLGIFGYVSCGVNVEVQACPTVLHHLSLEQCRDQPRIIDCPQFGCGDGRSCCPTTDTCGVRCAVTITKSVCPIPADIALLLDVSGFINDKDWAQVIEALERFVDLHDVSTTGRVQIGIITYGTNASLALAFYDFQNMHMHAVNVKRIIDSIEIKPGESNLAGALKVANENLFGAVRNGREVRKYCIIITSSGSQSSSVSGVSPVEAAQGIKEKGVSVHVVAVGSNDPSPDLYQTASTIDHLYHAKTAASVSEQLSKIARQECQGCGSLDVVVAIPTSLPPDELFHVKNTVNTFLSMFHVTNRLSHVGIVLYNEDASLYRPLGQDYTIHDVQESVNNIEISLLHGFNTARAMEVAADHAFTIYGGVRQSYSKVMVLFISSYDRSSYDDNQAAANKLKGMGVRVMVVGFNNYADPFVYSSIVSEPPDEFLVTGMFDFPELAYKMLRHMCEKSAVKSE